MTKIIPSNHLRKKSFRASIVVCALALGICVDASYAQAAFTLTFTQNGADVIAIGTGNIDTSSFTLTNLPLPATASQIDGVSGSVILGQQMTVQSLPKFSGSGIVYSVSFSDLFTFGFGSVAVPNAASGQIVGLSALGGYIYLPTGYVSNSVLGVTATWDNSTFDSLGLNQGTYVESFGAGPNVDTFTIQIGDTPLPPPLLPGSPPSVPEAVPEPASMVLVGAGILGLVAVRRSRFKR